MNVLFINPPLPVNPKSTLLHPPLGFAYIANSLKNDNHVVVIADMPIIGNTLDTLNNYLNDYNPEIIGITCVTETYAQALKVAKFIKGKKNCPIVFGGPHVTFIPGEILTRHPEIDYVISYDGETAFCELLQILENNGDVAQKLKVNNLSFRNGQQIIINSVGCCEKDIDKFGIPDRALFDMNFYLKRDYETVVMTARGCPGRCHFCSTSVMGRKYRTNSINHVLKEISNVIDLGFTSIFFGDDTFAGDKQRLGYLCDKIYEKKINIDWTCNIRVVDAEPSLLKKMKKAGAYRVFMGFESINYSTLKRMNKSTQGFNQIEAVKNVKEAGLEIHGSFLIGYPGDGEQLILDNVAFIKDVLKPTLVTFNMLEVRPGTLLSQDPEKFGIHLDDNYWYEKSTWLNDLPFSTNELSSKDIKRICTMCYDSFYNSCDL
ncbi:MAG: radical SAM protein [Melioribacteraceae bacterium]